MFQIKPNKVSPQIATLMEPPQLVMVVKWVSHVTNPSFLGLFFFAAVVKRISLVVKQTKSLSKSTVWDGCGFAEIWKKVMVFDKTIVKCSHMTVGCCNLVAKHPKCGHITEEPWTSELQIQIISFPASRSVRISVAKQSVVGRGLSPFSTTTQLTSGHSLTVCLPSALCLSATLLRGKYSAVLIISIVVSLLQRHKTLSSPCR